MERKILHVDMDAFFASVEVLDNKSLKGRPVIVGGTSERGVVATCSYEARKYGVRSAMPIFMAKARCPQGIYLPVRHSRYREISKEIFNIFYEITLYVEPLSIDEAFLDISHMDMNPVYIGNLLKERVKKEIGLTLSVGISYNKFLAKLGSDWNKPNGLKVITKEMIPNILLPLPINKVHGLGNKSVKKLNNIGVFTIEDLYNLSEEFFMDYFGKWGKEVYERIRGIDNREVKVIRERKSIGRETTLREDTKDKDKLKEYLRRFSYDISETMKGKNMRGKTITIKIKTSTFISHTKSKTLNNYISSENEIYKEALDVLNTIDFVETIRLIGVSVSSLKENKVEQISFFL
ncbi:DNA polymerase IV [Clostridium hydrogeniformans]|uniref:DNA polymerase IV n=1 Tax=Clostridium hydrogeniformans TaxID=349933 RepID=UPI0004818016|nr:DNA polymerase IV [Clostridium hydrogeniformans]